MTEDMKLIVATDWPAEEELASSGAGAGTTHLWEESWDDDDTSDEFSVQLQYVSPYRENTHLILHSNTTTRKELNKMEKR